MITEVSLRRFKRFESETLRLHTNGLTICAGPNSSGKSTLLHALAVWYFGVSVVRQFKGDEAIRAGYSGQGAGISAEDFTPINIPDLRHLWLDLKAQVPGEGYSMSISAKWEEPIDELDIESRKWELTMSFSLVQDRLYVKAESSNLTPNAILPVVVYVPPVAGVDAREEYATLPKRRTMLGRGLAGSILRNYLYDLEASSRKKKQELVDAKGGRRLSAKELRDFRERDPWERLNSISREKFGFDLRVVPFDPDFHSVLKVLVQPKKKNGQRWQNNGISRDLMVEGAGAQQWLTVLAFALSPNTHVLLLDEPDAHLFTGLKLDLVQILDSIAGEAGGPQILLATHAIEILKRHRVDRILNFGDQHPSFLYNDNQRSHLISGLGDDYSNLIENARASRALLFVENESDERILKSVAQTLELDWPSDLAVLTTTDKHGDRLKLYRSLLEAIDGLKAVSLRDRDHDLHINQVDPKSLRQKNIKTVGFPDFEPLTWRRREIENYALVASELSEVAGEAETQRWWAQQGWAWPQDLSVETHLQDQDVKDRLGDLLDSITVEDFMKKMKPQSIHSDVETVVRAICNMCR